jgi:geranylgeranyl diphosphate synthase type I
MNDALARWLEGHPRYLDGFYDMMRYQVIGDRDAVSTRTQIGLEQAATRLCLLSGQATGAPVENARRAVAAITLLFASFAIHDDLEHDRPLSGDRATLWKRCGLPQALNTGDGLFSLAANAILDAAGGAETAVRLVRELMIMSLAYMNGQRQLLSLTSPEASSSDARLRIARLTAGAPAGYAAWTGASLGDAGEPIAEALRRFGIAVGTAAGLDEEMEEVRQRCLETAIETLERADIRGADKAALRGLVGEL